MNAKGLPWFYDFVFIFLRNLTSVYQIKFGDPFLGILFSTSNQYKRWVKQF